jgi:hypothetical protein
MTANQAQAQTEFFESMPTTLSRASRELLKFVDVIEELEGFVSQAIRGARSIEDVHIQELQKLDHVSQMIVGAAEFLQALTQDMPPDWRVDARKAAKSVRLAELAGRLGDFATPAGDGKTHDSGACELFD